jgi:hypothetical protein
MEVEKTVAEVGTDAVLEYRRISSGIDNSVPEVFLGGFVAPRLHDRFRCPVHIEHRYLDIASSQNVSIDQEVIRKIGDLRADIAMYPAGVHPAVIELKIFDEDRGMPGVLADIEKMKKLTRICTVSSYMGLLVCPTGASLEENVRRIEAGLGRALEQGRVQRSVDGRWSWIFGCALV